MNYLHSELSLDQSVVVQVNLTGDAANVMLLDDANFQHYRDGRPFEHQAGGHYTQAPVVLKAPWDGSWHLVVDLGGRPGEVQASVAVRPAPDTEPAPPDGPAARAAAPDAGDATSPHGGDATSPHGGDATSPDATGADRDADEDD